MQAYLDLLSNILQNGVNKTDRTGVGTKSIFGYQLRIDLSKNFPLLTTKKMHFKSIIYELLWFLKGDTNIKYLKDNGISIWNEWADKNGDLGPIYGKQWRYWTSAEGKEYDQITNVINEIKTNPDSRRLIVNAWNVGDLKYMALTPCHCLFQFYVVEGKLSCQLYQRSADVFLGVPFNIASYAALTMMIAQICNLKLGEFIHTFGDVHLYNNHYKQAEEQLLRKPLELPTLILNKNINDIFLFDYKDFELKNYKSYSSIKAPIAI